MNLMLMFYFAGVVGAITTASSWIAVLFTVALVLTMCVLLDACLPKETDRVKDTLKMGVKLLTIPFVFVLIAVFTPSKETIYTMAAAYGVQEAVANPDVQRVAGKSLAVIEKTLDSYLKEGKSNEHSSE